MNIFSSKIEAFGLDISDFSLRIVKLKKKNHNFELSCFCEAGIPAGVVEQGTIKNEEALSGIIKRAKDSAKLGTDYSVCSLPEEKSFLDVFSIPKIGDEELENTVRFAAEHNIPVPLDEVYFDYERIGPQEVLVAAIPRETADSYSRAIKGAGLKVKAFEVEGLSVARTLIKKAVPKPLLIIDFGESRSGFIMFSGQSVRFSSSIPVSSRTLTEAVSKKLKISSKKAEDLKIKEGLNGKKNVFQAMLPELNNLVSQIKSHLAYYQSHVAEDKSGNLEKVLLCGGGANLEGLADFLTAELKLGVELANPWANISGSHQGLSFKKALGYATALGLGIRATYDD